MSLVTFAIVTAIEDEHKNIADEKKFNISYQRGLLMIKSIL